MTDNVELIDYDDLKGKIAEAIRTTLRELAAENGMSCDDYLDYYFGKQRRRRHPNCSSKDG